MLLALAVLVQVELADQHLTFAGADTVTWREIAAPRGCSHVGERFSRR